MPVLRRQTVSSITFQIHNIISTSFPVGISGLFNPEVGPLVQIKLCMGDSFVQAVPEGVAALAVTPCIRDVRTAIMTVIH